MPLADTAAAGVSYRRGTLFGFTLAEIVLLIIFALLLSLAALLVDKEKRIKELEQSSAGRLSVSSEEARLVEVLRQVYGRTPPSLPKPDDFFRQLRLLKDGADIRAMQKELTDLRQKVAEQAKRELPPIITVPTSTYFRLGEAKVPPEFRDRLVSKLIPELVDLGQRYNVQVIEIVGHTDELPVATSTRSNLDGTLLPFLNGRGADGDLAAGDNAGLGLARAAAVSRVLASDKRMGQFKVVLPLSAGQVVDVDQSISLGINPADVETRRRIEIRMRRFN